jgi:hypothetical protein
LINAPSWDKVWTILSKDVFSKTTPIGAYNCSFDKRMVEQSNKLAQIDNSLLMPKKSNWFCVMNLFGKQSLERTTTGRVKRFKLENALKSVDLCKNVD